MGRVPPGKSACRMECDGRSANGRAFPPKPQMTRLGWGTEHRAIVMQEGFGRASGRKYRPLSSPSAIWQNCSSRDAEAATAPCNGAGGEVVPCPADAH
jgi:hypothetical protein